MGHTQEPLIIDSDQYKNQSLILQLLKKIHLDLKYQVSNMQKNYYQTLQLKNDASQEEVAASYQKMVLRTHPHFSKDQHKTSLHHFSEISQAYEVLSDPLKRCFYDQHGYLKLKEGLFTEGQLKGGYRFADNPDQIFQRYFEEHNQFAKSVKKAVAERGSLFSHSFGGLNYSMKKFSADLVVEVPCTLTELYMGVAKNIAYERQELSLDGVTTKIIQQKKLIEIKPGYGTLTSLCFEGEGNPSGGRATTRLIFKITQIKHPQYRREGDDLIYETEISLSSALSCNSIDIRTLDNRTLKVSIDEIITPKKLTLVEGKGMPKEGLKQKGNLYVKFIIVFPKQIPEDRKTQLREILGKYKG